MSAVSGVTWTSCTGVWSSPRSTSKPRSRPSPAVSAPTSSPPRALFSTAHSWRSGFLTHAVPSRTLWWPSLTVSLPLLGHSRCHTVLQASVLESAQQTSAQVLCVLGEDSHGVGMRWQRHVYRRAGVVQSTVRDDLGLPTLSPTDLGPYFNSLTSRSLPVPYRL